MKIGFDLSGARSAGRKDAVSFVVVCWTIYYVLRRSR